MNAGKSHHFGEPERGVQLLLFCTFVDPRTAKRARRLEKQDEGQQVSREEILDAFREMFSQTLRPGGRWRSSFPDAVRRLAANWDDTRRRRIIVEVACEANETLVLLRDAYKALDNESDNEIVLALNFRLNGSVLQLAHGVKPQKNLGAAEVLEKLKEKRSGKKGRSVSFDALLKDIYEPMLKGAGTRSAIPWSQVTDAMRVLRGEHGRERAAIQTAEDIEFVREFPFHVDMLKILGPALGLSDEQMSVMIEALQEYELRQLRGSSKQ